MTITQVYDGQIRKFWHLLGPLSGGDCGDSPKVLFGELILRTYAR